jgi:hypothetical protein
MDCWTLHTQLGDFTIKENDQRRFAAYHDGESLLGGDTFWRAGQALEDLVEEFPWLAPFNDDWEYTPTVV